MYRGDLTKRWIMFACDWIVQSNAAYQKAVFFFFTTFISLNIFIHPQPYVDVYMNQWGLYRP